MLPNGQTIGQVVSQVNQSIESAMSNAVAAGEDPLFGAGGGAYIAAALPHGPLDFKNNFFGQADPGFLSAAGNFAFGAVTANIFGSGSFGQYVGLSGAGVYAFGVGKLGPGIPFLASPYGADPMAQRYT